MILKSIKLRNYRKYKDAWIEFPDGVIGILGLNGVGKTTLVEAIGWVLFGHHAARTKKEGIKRTGASPYEPCSVALEFELEGANYKVVREMMGKNLVPKANLTINGKLITNNAEKVTEFIEDKIGMDYQSFFTSVFARQKELNALSIMKAGERKKLVLKMLGIERIEGSIQSIRSDIRGKEKKIEGIKAATVDEEGEKKIIVLERKGKELETIRGEVLPRIKEIEAVKSIKENEAKNAEHELEIATKKYEKFIEMSNLLGKKGRDLENTKKRREEKETEFKKLILKGERLKEVEWKEGEYFDLRERKEEMNEIKSNYQRKKDLMKREEKTMFVIEEREQNINWLKEKRKEFEGIEEREEEIRKKIEEVRNEKEKLNSSLGVLKSRIMEDKEEIKEREEKKKNIEELGPNGECPMCERKLETHYEILLEKLSDEITKLKDKISSLIHEYKKEKEYLVSKERVDRKLREGEKELEKRVMEKRSMDIKMQHEEKELKGWKKELDRIKSELKPIVGVEFDENYYKDIIEGIANLEGVYREILSLRAEIGRTEDVKNNLQMLSELEREIREDIKVAQQEIEELSFDKREYEEMKVRYERKKEELNELRIQLLQTKNEFENVCRDIERIRGDIKELERLLKEKEKEETDIMYLGLLEKIMSDFKIYMVGMIRPMLSDYASLMLRTLTDGKYCKMELDENYDVFIYDEGMPYELNRFSGGEEDLANLCLRLAISAMISERSSIQTNFIILDEIFGSQDALRKKNIILALNELSKKFRQILLITHIEDVKDYMEYVLRVTEDEEGVSWVSLWE